MPLRVFIVVCCALWLTRSAGPIAQAPSIVFEHVNVISMAGAGVTLDTTVVVARTGAAGASIDRLGRDAAVPDGATRIDGRGKFLIPALAEMHAHIPNDAAEAERVLFMYVANGIGTIRSMLGDPSHFRLRDRVMKGEIVGPTMMLSGPSFSGTTAPTPAAATARVAEEKKAGYDFLKIHPGVPRTAFDALAAAADKSAIRFAGHVPADVGLQRALQAKYWTIDHLDGYVEALAGSGAPASENFGVNLMSRVDESRIPKLVADTKAAGTWNVPTETLLENWYGPDTPDEMRKRPEIQYVRPAELEQWVATKRTNLAQYSAKDRARFIAIRRQLIKALQDGGAGLLLGSDAPQVWNVPGFSIHRELASYVAAGLTPHQALATGTSNVLVAYRGNLDASKPTTFFAFPPLGGVVQPGVRADLVLLDANPLENIANSTRIAGVLIGGRWMPREEIQSRLEKLRVR